MFVKIVCLPFLQLGCAKAVGLSTPAGMSLIILSICPVATMSFVVSSQYNHGADCNHGADVGVMSVIIVSVMT
eukprot:781746-Pelagomonas_calceolata.AAC.1